MEIETKIKMTEVGALPIDWNVKILEECLSRNPDYGINAAAVQYNDILPTYLRITDITENGEFNSENKVSVNHPLSSLYFLEVGDIVFARTGASVGKTYLHKAKDGKLVFAGFLIRVRTDRKKLLPEFLQYNTQTKRYWNWVYANSMRSGQPGLNSNEYKSFLIPLPSDIKEQKKIISILNDIDELISRLGKLIFKKRNIKQGAMQQLLQPKDGWEVKTVFELAENKKELFDDGDWIEAEHITDKGVRLIQTGNIGLGSFIDKEEKKYIFQESFNKLYCKEIKEGDILICRLAEPAGRACILPKTDDYRMITSVDVTIFRPRKEIANRVYLKNVFSTLNWFKDVAEKCGGTTHKRISRSALGKINISLPSINEQNEVADVFSAMDSEIDILKAKLKKYKLIKQGMMQNLLTGKIRLV